MGDEVFRCRHCQRLRLKRTAEQRYCSGEGCQKARKNAWRRTKLALDPDYRANQRASTKAWLASQGGSGAYYRRYRKRRRQQACCADNADHVARPVRTPVVAAGAKSDAESGQSRVTSGRYRLLRCDAAKSDAIVVELSVVPDG
ncbi:MAG: hypothetical protein A2V88_13850 [Elusimicrobia bacterium RBG_16_66_12]|nr:MAG: hypothetical protein A2V88_13850 [Elusimicrobia bacterium RBG_16_66_12]